jgi:hypothetical protein
MAEKTTSVYDESKIKMWIDGLSVDGKMLSFIRE